MTNEKDRNNSNRRRNNDGTANRRQLIEVSFSYGFIRGRMTVFEGQEVGLEILERCGKLLMRDGTLIM
jgi:hypothetical protein